VSSTSSFDRQLTFSIFKVDVQEEVLNKKNVSRIRKKTFYLQFCMGTPDGNEFAAWIQPESKILKYWNIKSTNQNENFPKKSTFSTLKV
jgi:hypothetical protein